jgi:hypothetical protein
MTDRHTYDNEKIPNRSYDSSMQELISKANQVILEAQWLRQEGRALRFEASVLASRLGETIVQSQRVETQLSSLQTALNRSLFDAER